MPPIDNITKDFLRDVFRELKALFKVTEIKHIVVPHYEEISVKAVFETYKNDEALMKYLPEIRAKGKQLDRTFFFNILNTVYPEVLPAITPKPQNPVCILEFVNNWVSRLLKVGIRLDVYVK